MNVVTVLGDINKVQVNLNFYLKLTSTDSIKSVEALRRSMFDKFRQEDNIRYSNLASAYFEKQRQEELASLKALEEQKKEEISYVSTGVLLEDSEEEISEEVNNQVSTKYVEETLKESNVQDDIEYSKHGYFLEDEEEYNSAEVSYVSQGVLLDDTKDYRQEGIDDPDTQTILEAEDEDVEYSKHGVFLIDAEDNSMQQKDSSVEYSKHGIFLEDYDVSEKETSEENVKELPEESLEEIEYTSTGVILDDGDEADTLEESDISDDSSDEFGEYVEEYVEDSEIEDNVWEETIEEFEEEIYEESLPFESEVEDVNDNDEADTNVNKEYIDTEDFLEEAFSDDDDFSSIFGVPDTNKSKEVTVSVENKTNKNLNALASASKETKLSDKSSEEQTIPTDLRAFIKQFNNPTIEFTKQYFSEKEIKKQITQSRVFKRKNRLYI